MTVRVNRRSAIAVTVGIAILSTGALGYGVGFRVNTTPSIPVGLYHISAETANVGAYVSFCPPKGHLFDDAKERGYIEAGWCPGGYSHMLKKILAAKNDDVVIDDVGVFVNGRLLDHSQPKIADPAGRPLPVIRQGYHLDNHAVLVMTDQNDNSFDGRYFGPIDVDQITGVLRPLWTW